MLTRRSTIALALLFAVGSAQAQTVVAKKHAAPAKAHVVTAKKHVPAKKHVVARKHVAHAAGSASTLPAVARSPQDWVHAPAVPSLEPLPLEVAAPGLAMPAAAGTPVVPGGSAFSVPLLAQSPLNWGQKPAPVAHDVPSLRIGSAAPALAVVEHTPLQPASLAAGGTDDAGGMLDSPAEDTVDTVTTLRDALVQLAMSLRDIPYVSGGDTPSSGFDCSGFVRYVFAHVTGMRLPANAASQFLAGLKVSRGRLKAGDLVFFHTSGRRRISHVGIYLSNGRFIHAPTTGKSVEVSSLNESYWSRHFAGARRPAAIVAAANNG